MKRSTLSSTGPGTAWLISRRLSLYYYFLKQLFATWSTLTGIRLACPSVQLTNLFWTVLFTMMGSWKCTFMFPLIFAVLRISYFDLLDTDLLEITLNLLSGLHQSVCTSVCPLYDNKLEVVHMKCSIYVSSSTFSYPPQTALHLWTQLQYWLRCISAHRAKNIRCPAFNDWSWSVRTVSTEMTEFVQKG